MKKRQPKASYASSHLDSYAGIDWTAVTQQQAQSMLRRTTALYADLTKTYLGEAGSQESVTLLIAQLKQAAVDPKLIDLTQALEAKAGFSSSLLGQSETLLNNWISITSHAAHTHASSQQNAAAIAVFTGIRECLTPLRDQPKSRPSWEM